MISTSILSQLKRFPLVGTLIVFTTGFLDNLSFEFKGRRPSYRISVYYRFDSIHCIMGALLFTFFPMKIWNDYSLVERDVSQSSWLSDPLEIEFNTRVNRGAPKCGNTVESSCSYYSSVRPLVIFMWAIAALYALMGLLSLFLGISFSVFSNLPLSCVGTRSNDNVLVGGICKLLPRYVKVMRFIVFICLLVLCFMTSFGKFCLGNTRKTANCIHSRDSCLYNQINNCRYYFSEHCKGVGMPREENDQRSPHICSEIGERRPFSGRFDVRIVFPSVCQRCWVLHSDCLDSEINNIRFIDVGGDDGKIYKNNNKPVPFLGGTNSNLLKNVYCHCLGGKGVITASERLENRIIDFDLEYISGALKNNFTCSDHEFRICDPLLTGYPVWVSTQKEEGNSEGIDILRVPSLIMKTEAHITKCSWTKYPELSEDDFLYSFYEKPECHQIGAFINNRTAFSAFSMLTLFFITLTLSMYLRKSVTPETWFYTPHDPNESYTWKLTKFFGPI